MPVSTWLGSSDYCISFDKTHALEIDSLLDNFRITIPLTPLGLLGD